MAIFQNGKFWASGFGLATVFANLSMTDHPKPSRICEVLIKPFRLRYDFRF